MDRGPNRDRRAAAAQRRLDPPRAEARRRQSSSVIEPAPRMRIQQQRRKRAAKRTVLALGIVVLVLVLGGGVWVYSSLRSAQRTMNEQPEIDEGLAEVLTPRAPEEPFNVLLLGIDIRPGEEAARADTIIVARIDPEQKKVWMLSIPRDTRVEMPGYGEVKINSANFYGGAPLAVETVEQFLGIEINHYIGVNFKGFLKVVDALGGVWIDVDTDIDDPKASSHGSYRASHIDAGYQLLDGDHALTYVRSRDFPDADFTRMRHQQAFFKALADQAVQFKNVFKIPSLAKEISKDVSTDMSIGELADLALALKDMGSGNLQTATVAGTWRSPFVWPDEAKKQLLVDRMMAGEAFDATSTPTPAKSVDRSTVSVTVRNGAGIEGCAQAAADILKGKGYSIAGVGNANQFVYDRTLVVYKDQRDAATQVVSDLPKAELVPSRGMYEFGTDILVVVGKDYSAWGSGQ